MRSLRELFRPAQVQHRRQEQRQEEKERVSQLLGKGIQNLVQSKKITPDQGLKIMNDASPYTDTYGMFTGYFEGDTLNTAETQRLIGQRFG